MDKSSNFKPGIVINAISIRKTQCLISSHWVSIFVRKSIGGMSSNAALVLHKEIFENLDKTNNFNSLKFSICLNQREILYSMDKENFDCRAWFQVQMDILVFYCITDTTASDRL